MLCCVQFCVCIKFLLHKNQVPQTQNKTQPHTVHRIYCTTTWGPGTSWYQQLAALFGSLKSVRNFGYRHTSLTALSLYCIHLWTHPGYIFCPLCSGSKPWSKLDCTMLCSSTATQIMDWTDCPILPGKPWRSLMERWRQPKIKKKKERKSKSLSVCTERLE